MTKFIVQAEISSCDIIDAMEFEYGVEVEVEELDFNLYEVTILQQEDPELDLDREEIEHYLNGYR